MTLSYSFLMTVTTQVRVIVESETELSNAQVVEKAIQNPSGCNFDSDHLDWDDIKYALCEMSDTEKEHLASIVEVDKE